MTSIPFDICVLTAANDAQAKGYQQQLEWRKDESMLPETDFKVIADPDGTRIGSGGSTFYVLSELYTEYGDALFSKRTLILHSGGDSRRVPAYSTVGKLFMPLPTEEHHTLFDVMLDNYSTLPRPSDGHVVIASGDVLLNFDPAFINFSPSGVTGVAYSENPSEGEFFGVYVVKEPQSMCVPAVDMLQKPTLEKLREHEAIDAANRIWIDTGILNLAPDAIKTWLQCAKLIHAARDATVNYNLYHEILYAMHGKLEIEDSHLLNTLSVHVNCLPYCGFYHVGKSRDLLQNLYTLTHASVHYQFQNAVRSNAAFYPELKSAWIYNSLIESDQIAVKKPCLIEGCSVNNSLTLDGHNIVTNITQNVGPMHLSEGLCLNLLPLENSQWVAVLYGIDDAFKEPNATFLNQSFVNFKNDKNIVDTELWSGGDDETIWTAKLFPSGDNPVEVVECALELAQHELNQWRRVQRLSMAELLKSVDQIQLLKNHIAIREKNKILTIDDHLLKERFSFESLKKCLYTKADKEKAIASLERIQQKMDNNFLIQARAHFWTAQLVDGSDAEDHVARSFSSIRRAVAAGGCRPRRHRSQ